MTNNSSIPPDGPAAAPERAQQPLPLWRASFRMALVSAAGLVAAGLMATGLTGCADMSGIAPQSGLR
ncbi:MAG: hypothetical protein ACREXV_13360, partial [Polaromonas sp.]